MIKKLNANFAEGSPYPPSAHNAFTDHSASFSDSFGTDHDTDKHNSVRIAHAVAFYDGSLMIYSEHIDSIISLGSNQYGIALNPAIRMRSANHWSVIANSEVDLTICEQPQNRTDLYTTIRGSQFFDGTPFVIHVFGERA